MGVYFYSTLPTEKQINAITKACYYHIRNIGRIRCYITRDACKTISRALIVSRLEYGNVLLHGLLGTLMTRLKRVQRSKYKILMYTYKTQMGLPLGTSANKIRQVRVLIIDYHTKSTKRDIQ